MTLDAIFSVTCLLCGYHSTGSATWFGVRVNKTSVRAKSSLMFFPRNCSECGWPIPDAMAPPRYSLDEESQRKVDDARRKKGWI